VNGCVDALEGKALDYSSVNVFRRYPKSAANCAGFGKERKKIDDGVVSSRRMPFSRRFVDDSSSYFFWGGLRELPVVFLPSSR
jgi:hypothetical protein